MATRDPRLDPAHPERICWGCDKYCPTDDLACGGGTIRGLHPKELFGDDWLAWSSGRGRRAGSTRSRSDDTIPFSTQAVPRHRSEE